MRPPFSLSQQLVLCAALQADPRMHRTYRLERFAADGGTIAALGFLRLLVRLREVVIQDAACLRRLFPQHVLFAHPLFSTAAFLAFEAAMSSHLATAALPRELELERVLPELSASMNAQFDSQAQKTAELSAQVLGVVEAIAGLETKMVDSLARTHNIVTDLFSGRVPLRVTADFAAVATSSANTASSASTSTTTATTSSSGTTSTTAAPASCAAFRLNRNLVNVEQVVREWKEGLGGGPSVEDAYRPGGEGYLRLKKDGAEDKYYRRRRNIILKIEQMMDAHGISQAEAVRALDAFRGSQSLSKLQEILSRSPSTPIPLL